jgi:hypothetical protein
MTVVVLYSGFWRGCAQPNWLVRLCALGSGATLAKDRTPSVSRSEERDKRIELKTGREDQLDVSGAKTFGASMREIDVADDSFTGLTCRPS